jgi:hypothetical protein
LRERARWRFNNLLMGEGYRTSRGLNPSSIRALGQAFMPSPARFSDISFPLMDIDGAAFITH